MYINEAERTVLTKLAYYGPAGAGKAMLLWNLHDHYAARVGEHTLIDRERFVPREEVGRGQAAVEAYEYIKNVERAFGADYDELVHAGELVRLRTRLSTASAPTGYHRAVSVFTVNGDAFHGALRAYVLDGADSVVFVADARPERREATIEAWENLGESYDGPVVLLVNHADDPQEIGELLGFQGKEFAELGGFEGNHAAFLAATRMALKNFESLN